MVCLSDSRSQFFLKIHLIQEKGRENGKGRTHTHTHMSVSRHINVGRGEKDVHSTFFQARPGMSPECQTKRSLIIVYSLFCAKAKRNLRSNCPKGVTVGHSYRRTGFRNASLIPGQLIMSPTVFVFSLISWSNVNVF